MFALESKCRPGSSRLRCRPKIFALQDHYRAGDGSTGEACTSAVPHSDRAPPREKMSLGFRPLLLDTAIIVFVHVHVAK